MDTNFSAQSDFEHAVVGELFEMQDADYAVFNAKLIPTVDKSRIIGVRTPQLREYARRLKKDGRGDEFLSLNLPLFYYEEMNVRGFLIEQEKDFRRAAELTDGFLPYIDNWATCDMFSPKIFKRHTDELIVFVRKWLDSNDVYAVRYGVVTLLRHYLDGSFEPRYLDLVAELQSDEFYVNMAAAWYFSMALVKQFDSALPYIAEQRLPKWVHNKSIQKACESRQIAADVKLYLKSMKIK